MINALKIACASAALALAGSACAQQAPIRVILVGDSTMATHSGYGDALCARFTPDVNCIPRASARKAVGTKSKNS